MGHHIYLIGCNEHPDIFKIGYSKNPERRLKVDLQPYCPCDLFIIHTFTTSRPKTVEEMVHVIFWHRRIRGEWFKLQPQDLELFESWAEMHWQLRERMILQEYNVAFLRESERQKLAQLEDARIAVERLVTGGLA